MTKLLTALRRTLNPPYTEPAVHFHAAESDDYPEICYDGNRCPRPRFTP